VKISVITTTFNSEKTIERNVLSVINQVYRNFEQIIIDNKSSDGTLSLVTQLYDENGLNDQLKIISEKDNGISDAFNKGIKAAVGEIIGILNSDDAYYNDKVFEKVVNIFNDDEILFIHGDVYFEDPVYGSNIRKPLLCPVTTAMPYNHPTMFLRKEIYEKFGLFDLSFKYAMDYEFIIRLEKAFPEFKTKGKYFSDFPVAKMYSGGASWENELQSIEETKRALNKYSLWNSSARKNYLLRIIRTRLKKYLSLLNLYGLIKYWRNKKWGS
jgi:glycosyltransferase involved in cell wall biosynthesis